MSQNDVEEFVLLIQNFYTDQSKQNQTPKQNTNKNGVLWSQTRMRIEMRLRCFFGHLVIGNWQFVIGNGQ